MRKKYIHLFFVLIGMALILYFSIVPLVFPGEPGFMDKVKHFFAYFLLAFFMYLSTRNFRLAFFLAGLYGILMEALQFTLPFRSFSISDILVNYLGAFLIFSLRFFRRK